MITTCGMLVGFVFAGCHTDAGKDDTAIETIPPNTKKLGKCTSHKTLRIDNNLLHGQQYKSSCDKLDARTRKSSIINCMQLYRNQGTFTLSENTYLQRLTLRLHTTQATLALSHHQNPLACRDLDWEEQADKLLREIWHGPTFS